MNTIITFKEGKFITIDCDKILAYPSKFNDCRLEIWQIVLVKDILFFHRPQKNEFTLFDMEKFVNYLGATDALVFLQENNLPFESGCIRLTNKELKKQVVL